MADEKQATPVPPPSLPTFATQAPGSQPADDSVPPIKQEDHTMGDAMAGLEPSSEQLSTTAPTSTPNPASTAVPGTSTTTNAPSPAPPGMAPRTSTPLRNTDGAGSSSRAHSQHPDGAATGSSMPSAPAAHGAPVRQYLNQNITGVLLEGMKLIARDQPADPLRVLGEYLLKASKDAEATTASAPTA